MTGRTLLVGALTAGLTLSSASALADSCDTASREFARAQAADNEGRVDDARRLYTRAAGNCERSEYWNAVGDIWLSVFLDDQLGEGEGQEALEAFTKSYQLAFDERDKPAGARAARGLTDLGLRAGDPTRANEWLVHAEELDPGHGDLEDLRAEIDLAMAELSTDELSTGLSTTRGLGTVRDLMVGSGGAQRFWNQPKGAEPAAPTPAAPAGTPARVAPVEEVAGGDVQPSGGVALNVRRSINIPVKFEYNSAQVTAQTAQNIVNLAKVLLESKAGRFIFVGHTDATGDETYNLNLSRQRAETVRQQVLRYQPGLAGRIDVEGKGEYDLLDFGQSARAHANNRRLEIVIRD